MANDIYDTCTSKRKKMERQISFVIHFEGQLSSYTIKKVKYLTRVLSPLFIPSTDHGCGVHVSTVVVTAGAGGLINHWDGHLSQNRV